MIWTEIIYGHISYSFDRLTGFYAFFIFFLATVWRHFGSGPNHTLWYESERCTKNPWVDLLYINNFRIDYLEDQGDCLGQTWYLANDMQFFLIAPPIIYMIWRWKKIGFSLIGESTVRSLVQLVSIWVSKKHWMVFPHTYSLLFNVWLQTLYLLKTTWTQ